MFDQAARECIILIVFFLSRDVSVIQQIHHQHDSLLAAVYYNSCQTSAMISSMVIHKGVLGEKKEQQSAC